MLLKSTQLPGLLGVIVLSAGLASSLASGSMLDENSKSTGSVTDKAQPKAQSADSEDQSKEQSTESDMIEVRISLPDGRTIIRKEPARKARGNNRRGVRKSTSRSSGSGAVQRTTGRSGSGSRGSAGTSSGSSGSSGTSGSTGSSGGSSGSGGGSSSSGGGSGSGSTSSGSLGSSDVQSKSGESERSADKSNRAHRGVHSYAAPQTQSTGVAKGTAPAQRGSTHSASDRKHQSVSSVGAARHHQGGATGGQRVEFRDAGMGAAVIGNTVFFNNVELVRADRVFEVVTGTPVGGDAAIMQRGRLASSSNPLSSWNTGSSAIKLDFPSNTIVTLTMHSLPEDESNPDRVTRTWTVRIR